MNEKLDELLDKLIDNAIDYANTDGSRNRAKYKVEMASALTQIRALFAQQAAALTEITTLDRKLTQCRDNYINAHTQGQEARHWGKQESDNPHTDDGNKASGWSRGWNEMDHYLRMLAAEEQLAQAQERVTQLEEANRLRPVDEFPPREPDRKKWIDNVSIDVLIETPCDREVGYYDFEEAKWWPTSEEMTGWRYLPGTEPQQ